MEGNLPIHALLRWATKATERPLLKIQQLANGVHFCIFLNLLTHGKYSTKKINFGASLQYENLHNAIINIRNEDTWDLSLCRCTSVMKQIDLIANGNIPQCLDLLKWFHQELAQKKVTTFRNLKFEVDALTFRENIKKEQIKKSYSKICYSQKPNMSTKDQESIKKSQSKICYSQKPAISIKDQIYMSRLTYQRENSDISSNANMDFSFRPHEEEEQFEQLHSITLARYYTKKYIKDNLRVNTNTNLYKSKFLDKFEKWFHQTLTNLKEKNIHTQNVQLVISKRIVSVFLLREVNLIRKQQNLQEVQCSPLYFQIELKNDNFQQSAGAQQIMSFQKSDEMKKKIKHRQNNRKYLKKKKSLEKRSNSQDEDISDNYD